MVNTEPDFRNHALAEWKIKIPVQLSGPLSRRLNAYALPSGAAGVAVLACTLPAEGAPVARIFRPN